MNIRLSTPAESELLVEKNHDFKKTQSSFSHQPAPLLINYVIEENSIVIGGINAILFHWGMLIIDILFIEESHRGKDLGTALMQKVETEAKVMGAILARVETFEFQAKDFYVKLGYEIHGKFDDCPKGHTLYSLQKRL
jgi:GNAT superfamily N-acetyltransferase